MLLDRLTLDDEHGAVEVTNEAAEAPEEELLRLDDGTPLPAELHPPGGPLAATRSFHPAGLRPRHHPAHPCARRVCGPAPSPH